VPAGGGDGDVRRVLRVLDLLKPSNSLTLRPSCATEMRAPLQASWTEPPPMETKLSQAFCWYMDTASMTL
jgi:hypothetical protein